MRLEQDDPWIVSKRFDRFEQIKSDSQSVLLTGRADWLHLKGAGGVMNRNSAIGRALSLGMVIVLATALFPFPVYSQEIVDGTPYLSNTSETESADSQLGSSDDEQTSEGIIQELGVAADTGVTTSNGESDLAGGVSSDQQETSKGLLSVSEIITADIGYSSNDVGDERNTLPCAFRVLTEDANAQTGTVAVYSAGASKSRAIDVKASGTITLPETITVGGITYTVTEIGSYAFGGSNATNSCTKLTSVQLPDTIEKIGDYSFYSCSALESVNLDEGLTSIGKYAFYSCEALQGIALPSSLKTLGSGSFRQCMGIETITIPSGVSSIGDYVFNAMNNLRTVIFEGDASKIAFGGSPFSDKLSLSEVIFEKGKPTQKDILGNLTSNPPTVFYGVDFYETQQDASSETNCLGSAIIKSGTTLSEITDSLTGQDEELYSGGVPAYPTDTNHWIFQGEPPAYSGLDDAGYAYATYRDPHYDADIANGSISVEGDFSYTGTAVVPLFEIISSAGESLAAGVDYTVSYQRQDEQGVWHDTDDLIDTGVVQAIVTAAEGSGYSGFLTTTFIIYSTAGTTFEYSITHTSPEGVTDTIPCLFKILSVEESGDIGTAAVLPYYGDDNKISPAASAIDPATTGSIVIPETVEISNTVLSVTQISDYSFGGLSQYLPYAYPYTATPCQSLSEVSLPASLQTIGRAAFAYCTGLEAVHFADGSNLTSVEASAFSDCTALETFEMPGQVQTIDQEAFAKCSALSSALVIPASCTAIGSSAFSNCRKIPSVTFEEDIRLTAIDPYAFSGCDSVKELSIPKSVSQIYSGFANMKNLEEVTFEGDASTITFGLLPFENDTKLKTVIYKAAKNDNQATVFAVTGNPTYYYTISYYEAKLLAGQATPSLLGSAVVEGGTRFGAIVGLPFNSPVILEGSVPELPGDNLYNTWAYDVVPDAVYSLTKIVENSAAAYPYLINDVLSLEDAQINGLEESYYYTGEPISLDLEVIPVNGGLLAEDRDYTVEYQRSGEDGEWVSTTDLTSTGKLRIIVTGKDEYYGSVTLETEIIVYVPAVGDVISADIPLTTPEGQTTTTPCQFLVEAEGTVSVYGDYKNGNAAIASDAAGTVEIPSIISSHGNTYTVDAIGDSAFRHVQNLEGAVIPKTVTTVEDYAFASCGNLSEVVFADRNESMLSHIGNSAFQNTAVVSLELPSNLRTIDSSAFANCSQLNSVSFGETTPRITSLGAQAFVYCSSLTTIEIPDSLTEAHYAFTQSGLETVTFAAGTTRTLIPDYMFYGSRMLSSVALPESITTIGEYAFFLNNMETVVIPKNVTSIGRNAFTSSIAGPSVMKTVIFEGDTTNLTCPSVGGLVYPPFVDNTEITTVVFRDKASPSVYAMFKTSEGLPVLPNYYYTVKFFEDEQSALAGDTPLGEAAVLKDTEFSSIGSDINGSTAVFDGSIPSLPSTGNLWLYENDRAPVEGLDGSLYAYAINCDLNDLANARIYKGSDADTFKYNGNPIEPSYPVVSATGTILREGVDYTIGYERENDVGEWVASNDITSLGTVRIVATAVGGSGYSGNVSTTFRIVSHLAGEFFTSMDANGHTLSYKVLDLGDGEDTATVALTAEGDTEAPALAPASSGDVVVPEHPLDEEGTAYTVVEYGDYAFYGCSAIDSVTIPSSVERIGHSAFFNCYNIKSIIFEGSAADIVFGNYWGETRVFNECDDIENIVYGGKKGSFSQYGDSSGIQEYYRVSYYASVEDMQDGTVLAAPIVKAGTRLASVGSADYWQGSVLIPDLPEGTKWAYENGFSATNGIDDSLFVYASPVSEHEFVASATLSEGENVQEISCRYEIISLDEGTQTGTVRVGVEEDDGLAIDAASEGILEIPSEVRDTLGNTYTVTEIAPFAFGAIEANEACLNLDAVVIPGTVVSIGQAAFANCEALNHISFSDDSLLVSLGATAFSGCSQLSTLNLPASLSEIGVSAFEGASSLTTIEIPHNVSSLGKRAFQNCISLKEVLFAGDSTVLDSTAPLLAKSFKASDTNLLLVDDYTFAACFSLQKITFGTDAADVIVSDQAFVDCAEIDTVIYGGTKPSSAIFGISNPTIYYTVSYYDSAAAFNLNERLGYALVKAGTVLDVVSPDDCYEGFSIPDAPDQYHWAYAVETDIPLSDSTYALKEKTRYDIQTEHNDPIFTVTSRVNGADMKTASQGDTVAVTVVAIESGDGTSSLVKPVGFTVADQSDQVLYTSDQPTGIFEMPGGPVTINVLYDMEIQVYSKSTTGTSTLVKSITINELEELARNTEPAYYTGWDKKPTTAISKAERYVTLTDFLDACGLDFLSGDSLEIVAADGEIRTGSDGGLTYDNLYGKSRYYFPNINSDTPTQDMVSTEPVLTITGYQSRFENIPSGQTIDDFECDMLRTCRFLFGQTEEELLDGSPTVNSFLYSIVSITVVSEGADISGYEISGVDDYYVYDDGNPVHPPGITVLAEDGTVLTEDEDYVVSYMSDVDPGTATVTVSAMGNYSGSISRTYKIVEATEVSGASRYETAVDAALSSYPDGSQGVILAVGSDFPDALASCGLSGLLDYPILLTANGTLPSETSQAIATLKGGNPSFEVLVIGGEGAISSTVFNALKRYDAQPQRIYGNSRYETAYAIYSYGMTASPGGWDDKAIVVTGTGFADVLSMAPYAVHSAAPIFLASPSSGLIGEVEGSLNNFSSAIIAGGSSAVSTSVENQLKGVFGATGVERLSGEDRYDTSVQAASWIIANVDGISWDNVGFTKGADFPDGLSGAPLQAKLGSVMLLTSESDTYVPRVLADQKDSIYRIRFFGGTASTTPVMRSQIIEALGWPSKVLS